ncbi:MAG TPA: alpha/beta hydrolase [Patescibacteria group bacterium]|nr:alpha/beta hydrolase [Patescibacteria group bacterium]
MRIAVAGHEAYAYTGSRAFDSKLATIVFVHGAANDHGVWALQSRYFAHHGRNALAIDLPGHGRSAGAPLRSVPEIADWLIALLDALRVSAATVAGHSMGSLAALDAAGRHPDRIEKIALLAPAVPMRVAEPLLEAARRDDHVAFEMINGWSFSPTDQLGGNRFPGVWMTGNGLRLMERSRPGALYADLRACHQYADGLTAARNVRCPSLVLLGERDQMAPPKNAAALIAVLVEERAIAIPDCGHSLMVEAPDAVLDALREFLQR